MVLAELAWKKIDKARKSMECESEKTEPPKKRLRRMNAKYFDDC